MKLNAFYTRTVTNENNELELTFTAKGEDKRLARKAAELPKDKKQTIEIKEWKESRSKDANAYMWTLLRNLAKTLSNRYSKPYTDIELYRKYVRESGVYTDKQMHKDVAVLLITAWQERGLAWIVDLLDRDGDNVTLRLYFGSSSYNKSEMARLIDSIIVDCKEFGVETKTPRELEDLLNLWEKAYEKHNSK